jgi:threonine dehydratase
MPAGRLLPSATPAAAADRPRIVLTPKAERIAGEYLKRVLTAKVYDVARETPLDPARNLSRRLGNTVLLKREDQQPVFSFKLRGAYNKMPRAWLLRPSAWVAGPSS